MSDADQRLPGTEAAAHTFLARVLLDGAQPGHAATRRTTVPYRELFGSIVERNSPLLFPGHGFPGEYHVRVHHGNNRADGNSFYGEIPGFSFYQPDNFPDCGAIALS